MSNKNGVVSSVYLFQRKVQMVCDFDNITTLVVTFSFYLSCFFTLKEFLDIKHEGHVNRMLYYENIKALWHSLFF